MPKIALVRVVGFSHAERHALGSLLRISQQRSPSFTQWTVHAEHEPSILLVDAQHPQASSFAQQHRGDPQAKVLWVGAEPHIFAWRNYQRPISWVKILRGMDDAYTATHTQIDSDFLESEPIKVDAAGQALQAPTPKPARKRVLVVDDDQTARLYLKAKLLLAGPVTDIDQASSGDEALQMVRTFSYDAVLLDINMPGTDGYTVCRSIKRPAPNSPASARGGVPKVILITSRSGVVDRMRASLAGADAFLSKPAHPAKLKELISSL